MAGSLRENQFITSTAINSDKDDVLLEGLKLKDKFHNLQREFKQLISNTNSHNESNLTASHSDHRFCHMSCSPNRNYLTKLYKSPDPKCQKLTPPLKRQRRDIVLVSGDFNDDRAAFTNPSGIKVSSRPRKVTDTIQLIDSPNIYCTPSSNSRGIYRNHKMRLMAKRQSGDGAEMDRKSHFDLCSRQQSLTIVSPMRRIPLQHVSKVTSPLAERTDQYHYDTTPEKRLSPEGVSYCEQPRNNKLRAQTANQENYFYNKYGHIGKKSYERQKHGQAVKKCFPKTPSKMNFKLMKSQSNTASQTTLVAINDISQISATSKQSLHEQPSNINMKEQLNTNSSFSYPLHSTMSYPLHSTMQNCNFDLDISDLQHQSEVIIDNAKADIHNSMDLKEQNNFSDSENHVVKKRCNGLHTATDQFSSENSKINSDEQNTADSFFGIKLIPTLTADVFKQYYSVTTDNLESVDDGSSYLSCDVDASQIETKQHHTEMTDLVSCQCHKTSVQNNSSSGTLTLQHSNHSTCKSPSNHKDFSVKNMKIFQPKCLTKMFETLGESFSDDSDSSTAAVVQMPNRINAESLLQVSQDTCISPVTQNSLNAHRKSARLVQDIVKISEFNNYNCLQLGKLTKPNNKSHNHFTKETLENSIKNHTSQHLNVTIAQGCLGGILKKKKKSPTKKSLKRTKAVFAQDRVDENKENQPIWNRQINYGQNKINEFNSGSNHKSRTCHSDSNLCNSMFHNRIDKRRKTRLLKKMQNFQDSTFGNSMKMKTLGQF